MLPRSQPIKIVEYLVGCCIPPCSIGRGWREWNCAARTTRASRCRGGQAEIDKGAAKILSRGSFCGGDMRVHLARCLCKRSRAHDEDGSGKNEARSKFHGTVSPRVSPHVISLCLVREANSQAVLTILIVRDRYSPGPRRGARSRKCAFQQVFRPSAARGSSRRCCRAELSCRHSCGTKRLAGFVS